MSTTITAVGNGNSPHFRRNWLWFVGFWWWLACIVHCHRHLGRSGAALNNHSNHDNNIIIIRGNLGTTAADNIFIVGGCRVRASIIRGGGIHCIHAFATVSLANCHNHTRTRKGWLKGWADNITLSLDDNCEASGGSTRDRLTVTLNIKQK